jgi:hypothetical protein
MKDWVRFAGRVVLPFAVLGIVGCVGTTWESTRKDDTVAAYHRFLRANPDSGHAQEARERLEYLRLKTHPTLASFEEFESSFPGSPLVDDLRVRVEPLYFEQARVDNSAEAYREFLRNYPNGALTERARGNLAYRSRVAGSTDPQVLGWFTETHPESDFAEEARHSLELLDLRNRAGIESLGVIVRVGPGVTNPERVRRGFAGVIGEEYSKYGVEVFLVHEAHGIPEELEAWMQLDYHEVPAQGVLGGRTLVARCRVRLFHRSESDPIWDRTFEAPADHIGRQTQKDPTVFGNSKYRFWDDFFVPVSTWPTSRSRTLRLEFPEPVVDISLRGDRGVVLMRNGSLEYIDLANALEAQTLSRYRHPRDLTRWSGVVLLSDNRAVAYGPDGAQMVDLTRAKGERVARWEPLDVGVVRGAARSGNTVLLAGDRGLYAVRSMREPPSLHRLKDEPLVGVAMAGPFVQLISKTEIGTFSGAELARWSGEQNWAATPALARMKFPESFVPKRVRQMGDRLFVLAEKTVLELHLSDPKQPKAVDKFDVEDFGDVSDLVTFGDRVFVVGSHGLEIIERGASGPIDTIQVDAAERIQAKGRFLLLTGSNLLEVVDVSPYGSAPASAAQP